MEAAERRRGLLSMHDYEQMVLAVNRGMVITHDRDALRRWQREHAPRRMPTVAAQNATLATLANLFPSKVQTH